MPRREMDADAMRRLGDPIDQRLRAIAAALGVEDEHEAHGIVRQSSEGGLTRDVQILLESLFE